MKLIVGLGNPKKKYQFNRHNIGFQVLDSIAEKNHLEFFPKKKSLIARREYLNDSILYVKPLTFVNRSGEAVRELVQLYQLDSQDYLIIYDDIHLPLGKIRYRKKGSAGGHNGLASIIDLLNTDQICRLRIGVGKPEYSGELSEYVLGDFQPEERKTLKDLIPTIRESIDVFISKSIHEAMNLYNGL